MAKHIIIRPLITEKTTKLADGLNQYVFEVNKKANKVEIRKAVEEQFGVTVENVNTSIRPGKRRSRIVKGRMTKGQTSPVKRAFVTVAEGEFIEGFYGEDDLEDIEEEVTEEDEEVNA